MAIDFAHARDIFIAAVEKHAAHDRTAFLDEACGNDEELRHHVDLLLGAHGQSRCFLDQGAFAIPAIDEALSEKPGKQIGPYKLLEQIGEGGFGVVFLAEQERPVKRRVALKVIKPGLDTRQVIARFEAERQALAMMDHPNIAKVLDAGTTGAGSREQGAWSTDEALLPAPCSLLLAPSSGRPYFVMDLVKGVPITEYCDQQHLSVRQRLELMIQVCHAVQHAHQKGIIHRDLKPSNVLVAEYDGRPVPKIIDFGVAKATAQKLTERTMFTQYGQIVGTFEYMSPEQARFNQLDIDTRSDIYSLGVLLYELLAGSTPLEKERLRSAAFDEILRIIGEEEPPKPSTRLSSSQSLPSIAENRHTEPTRLGKDIRGELDWIVMKCLEKDRNRRYETASGLALDIQRYLKDEPVLACPPSTRYRIAKFATRNRFAIRVGGLVMFALTAGTCVSIWQAVRATRAEKQALQAQVLSHQAINDYFTQVSEDEALRYEPALQPLRQRLLRTALGYYEQFVRQDRASPQMRAEMAATCSRIGILTYELGTGEDWLDWLDKSNAIIEQLLNEQHDLSQFPDLTAGQRWLVGNITMWVGDRERSKRILEKWGYVAQELARRFPTVSGFQNDIAAYHMAMGKIYKRSDSAKALKLVTKAHHIWETLAHEHPDVPEYRAALASSICYTATMRVYAKQLGAEKEMRHAVDLYRDLVVDYPNVPSYCEGLGTMHEEFGFVLEHQGDYERAEDEYRHMIRNYDELHQKYPTSIHLQLGVLRGRMWLGELLYHKDPDEAKTQFQEALQLGEKIGEGDLFASYYFAYFLANCADPLFRDPDRAKQLAEKVVEQVKGLGDGWITLGWARYRSNDYGGAVEALETGTRLLTNYDTCTAHFYLAMANQKLQRRKEALRCFEAGITQLKKEYDMLEYHRVRNEAARELGLPIAESKSSIAYSNAPSENTPAGVLNEQPTTTDD